MFGRRRKPEPDPESISDAREWVRQFVLPGFYRRDEAKQALQEFLDDPPLDEGTISRIVDEVWESRRAEEAVWDDEGDYSKVAAAFAELETAGFVARMNFTCCQTCGHTEIKDEATGTERGYVFFHQQDSQRLADPDAVLFLAFGVLSAHPSIDQDLYAKAVEGDKAAQSVLTPMLDEIELEIADQVVDAMERQGLRVDRRDRASRPAVQVPEWRKRMPG